MFFDNPSGHGHPRRRSWTSAPKLRSLAAPLIGRNLLTPGHPGLWVTDVHDKSGPNNECLIKHCLCYSPDFFHSHQIDLHYLTMFERHHLMNIVLRGGVLLSGLPLPNSRDFKSRASFTPRNVRAQDIGGLDEETSLRQEMYGEGRGKVPEGCSDPISYGNARWHYGLESTSWCTEIASRIASNLASPQQNRQHSRRKNGFQLGNRSSK